ncbi:hypothetical protein [Acidicapsa ligni]|uniref:hypothetical protein n=1 Tax=Acidicapsa ligni TaxID=542300 RepID=UPI0021DF6AC1|nr:hypothetical protein [Acidicapsa ligni]
MKNDTVVVLTARSVERMVGEGGSQAWRLVPGHARQMNYIVCTRNTRAAWGDGHEDHRSGFLIAKVRDVVPSPEEPLRWMVRFSEYALINVPELWKKGDRNPVRYGSVADLGIDPKKLKWKAMPGEESGEAEAVDTTASHPPKTKPLTISEAKHGLAMAFNVPVEAVEITIRA